LRIWHCGSSFRLYNVAILNRGLTWSRLLAEKNSIATCICTAGLADLTPLDGKEMKNFRFAWGADEARGYIGFRVCPYKERDVSVRFLTEK
jgi:hypothetical protein